MSSQQRSTPQDGAKLVRHTVVLAWIAGFVLGGAIWQFLTDLALGGHWLVRGGIGLFTAAGLTLSTYFLTRTALNSPE
jgi:high-affinity Fe2+/Pb2+ permease